MKRFFFVCILVLLSWSSRAQFASNTDIGFTVGTSYYIGDINQTYHFYQPSIAVGGLLRKNFNDRYSLRGTVQYAGLQADDMSFDSSFKRARQHSFSTKVFEFAVCGEFNFFPFGTIDRRNKFSPYIVAGLAGSYIDTPANSFFALGIPFGAGVKIDLSDRVKMNIEFAPRRTFTDDLEGFPAETFIENGKQMYSTNNTDWYYVVSVQLSLKFYKSYGSCAAYRVHSGR